MAKFVLAGWTDIGFKLINFSAVFKTNIPDIVIIKYTIIVHCMDKTSLCLLNAFRSDSVFFWTGKADCPYYAKAEFLADLLQSILPDFCIHKICMLPNAWQVKPHGKPHTTTLCHSRCIYWKECVKSFLSELARGHLLIQRLETRGQPHGVEGADRAWRKGHASRGIQWFSWICPGILMKRYYKGWCGG